MKTCKLSLVLPTLENTDVFYYTGWKYLWYALQKGKLSSTISLELIVMGTYNTLTEKNNCHVNPCPAE